MLITCNQRYDCVNQSGKGQISAIVYSKRKKTRIYVRDPVLKIYFRLFLLKSHIKMINEY